MSKTYQIVDVTGYRQEKDRDLWCVLFEHERERGYTWQPSPQDGCVHGNSRRSNANELLKFSRPATATRWVASMKLKHELKVKVLWLLSGFSLASMACAGTERWRETLNDPLAFRAFQLTLPICWWIILGLALTAIFVWQALRLAQQPLYHPGLRNSRVTRSVSEKDRPPKPTRIQPHRSCRRM